MPKVWLGRSGFWHLGHLPLSYPSLGRCCPGLQRCLVGHTVEPVGDQLPRQDRGGLADEDQKGGLERVLRVVVIAEDTAAYPPHHRTAKIIGRQRLPASDRHRGICPTK